MSITRWGVDNSDVYIIGALDSDGQEVWECVGCDGPHNAAPTADEFAKHLEWHRQRGDSIPDHAEGAIRAEEADKVAKARR